MSRPKNGPTKKDKQALRGRMASKKGQTVQLQTEVNNEDDWEKLLTKEGLIVVDVYSDWCGPCVGMVGNLKKVKVEMGGDSLHLAIAKSDEIEALKRFRNKSEPTWMFIGGGQLINVTFGANAPRVCKMIEAELRQEQRVMRGETWRRSVPFSELCEEERERAEAAEKVRMEVEREAAEKKALDQEEKRLRIYTQMAEHFVHETIVVCFPHTIREDVGCVMTTELEAFFRSKSLYVSTQNKVLITPDIMDEVFYRGSIERSDDLMEDLASGPSLALWIKCQVIPGPEQEGPKDLGEIEKFVCQELYMTEVEEGQELVTPDPKSLPAKYMWIKPLPDGEDAGDDETAPQEHGIPTSVPGCWTPASYFTKCAACRFLMPSRAEKIIGAEDALSPPKIVVVFDVSKQKECFDLAAEYPNDVLNMGYFNSADPASAKQLCENPEQYARLPQLETNKVVIVLSKAKSDALLSFAGLGASYVSPDEETGALEADKFFPPGIEQNFSLVSVKEKKDEEESISEEEPESPGEEMEEAANIQTDDELMAALGLSPPPP